MKFVLRERSCIAKSLADICFFEVRQFLDDLGSSHAVCDEIHDMSDGDAQAANGRPTG